MIKSRTINKYLKGCLIASAAAVTVMSTSIFQTLAAGNYKDTVHEEYNSTDLVEVTDIITGQRGKWDYTSSYAYNKIQIRILMRYLYMAHIMKIMTRVVENQHMMDCIIAHMVKH